MTALIKVAVQMPRKEGYLEACTSAGCFLGAIVTSCGGLDAIVLRKVAVQMSMRVTLRHAHLLSGRHCDFI